MLEVGEEEPNCITKTDADDGVPVPKETVRRIPQEVDARGRRSGPRAAAIRPEGATKRQCTGWGHDGKTSGWRRRPRAATLQPEGATQRQPDARSMEGARFTQDSLHETRGGTCNRRARSVARRR